MSLHRKQQDTHLVFVTKMGRFQQSFLAFLLVIVAAFRSSSSSSVGGEAESSLVTIVNHSGVTVKIRYQNGRLAQQRVIPSGTLQSVQLLGASSMDVIEDDCTGSISRDCPMMTSWPLRDMVQSSHWVVTVQPDFSLHQESTRQTALQQTKDWIHPCKGQARELLKRGGAEPTAILSEMATCIQNAASPTLRQLEQRLQDEANWRRKLAEQFEAYTCADDALPSNDAIAIREWIDPASTANSDRPLTVHILHHRQASQIHLVDDFISDEECAAIHHEAGPHLTIASTFDEKGGITYSESRKAMQSSITLSSLPQDSPIHALANRIFTYANHSMGDLVEIQPIGQENLMSIQYVGRGINDTAPDQYLPHCDGNCDGKPYVFATRVASMVMYCAIPTKGGATNFRNAGLHIQPRKNNALFFSYVNPETMMMDSGFTTHSGCPVYEGEKRIVTEWMRVGVTDDVPWNAYNTLGERLGPKMDAIRRQFKGIDWAGAVAAAEALKAEKAAAEGSEETTADS